MPTSQSKTAGAPSISVIIPCFNSGQYLQEALDSVAAYTGPQTYEVLIVNDGSTDGATLALLSRLEAGGQHVLHQVNKGPAAARNTGIAASRGEYLLFLDSDNRLRPAFFDVGSRLLREQPLVGVVHGKADFFGEEGSKPRFRPRPFDIYAIIAHNYVDMCAMVRRAAWQFSFVDQVLFDYRIGSDSLVAQATHGDKYTHMRQYVHHKHWQLFADAYGVLAEEYLAYQHDKDKPLRSFVKYLYGKVSGKKG